MILAAAYVLISLVVITACLRALRLPPFTRPALHAAPRHRGHADVWDDEPPTFWHAPVSQQDIDERDSYLERGLGLPDDDDWTISAEEFEAARADLIERFGSVPPSLQAIADRGGRYGLPMTGEQRLRTGLAAADAPPVTEREHRAIAARIRDAQSRPMSVLPETPAYRPPPVDRKPRVAARRHAADRSAGQTGPRMMPLTGRDERDFPHLAPAPWDATGSFAAYCEAGNG